MITIKPTILFGLGEYGCKIVNTFFNKLEEDSHSLLRNIIKGCYISEDKQFIIDESNIEFSKLNSNYANFKNNFFSHNHSVIYEKADSIINITHDLLNKLQSVNYESLLIKNNIQRQENQIIIISSVFDAIGSSVILPLLKILLKINEKFTFNLLLLLPGLSNTQEIDTKKIEYARAYACLSELDQELLDIDKIHGVFLIENKNEEAATIGSFNNILSLVPDFLQMLIEDKIFTTTEITDIIGLPVAGSDKYSFYSSFGIGKIRYPVSRLLETLYCKVNDHLLNKIIEPIRKSEEQKLSKDVIGADTRRFILNNELLNIIKLLKTDEDKNSVFNQFKIQNFSLEPNTEVNDFINSYNSQINGYERNTFTDVIKKIDENSNSLYERIKKKIFQFIEESFKINLNGAYSYLISFFDYLLQKDSKYLKSEEINLAVINFNNILSNINEFYEEKLKIKPDRKRLEELNLAINNKEEFINKLSSESNTEVEEIKKQKQELHELTEEFNQLRSRIKSLETKISDPAFRIELLRNENDEFNSKIEEKLKNIKNHEQPLKAKRNEYEELKLKKSKFSKLLFVIYPIIIGIILSVLLFLYFKNLDSFVNLSKVFFSSKILFIAFVLLIVFIIYVVWAYIHYNKNIGNPLKKCRHELKILERNKIDNFNQLISLSNNKYHNEFVHRIHSTALSIFHDLNKFINDCSEKSAIFKGEIEKTREKYNKKYQEILNREDQFNECDVFNNDFIEYFFSQKIDFINAFFTKGYTISINDEKEKLIGGKQISHYLLNFIQNDYKAIDSLKDEIKCFTDEIFYFLKEKNIHNVLFDKKLCSDLNKDQKFKLLLSSSNSWVKLNQDNINDVSFSFSNIYLDTNNQTLAAEVKEVLNDLSGGDHNYIFGNRNEITRLKIRAGFPAFSLSSLSEFYNNLMNFLEPNSKFSIEDFYLIPTYSTYNLFNEFEIDKTKKGATFEIVILSVALNLIQNQNNYYLLSKRKFETLLDLETFLDSNEGKSFTNTLKIKIEEIKTKAQDEYNYSTEIKSQLDIFLETDILNQYHREVITDFINSISKF